MNVLNYNTYTDFDKSLFLTITESNDGRKTYKRYEGFRSLEEGRKFTEWWMDLWEFGYSGWASGPLTDENGNIFILAEHYNSCD